MIIVYLLAIYGTIGLVTDAIAALRNIEQRKRSA